VVFFFRLIDWRAVEARIFGLVVDLLGGFFVGFTDGRSKSFNSTTKIRSQSAQALGAEYG